MANPIFPDYGFLGHSFESCEDNACQSTALTDSPFSSGYNGSSDSRAPSTPSRMPHSSPLDGSHNTPNRRAPTSHRYYPSYEMVSVRHRESQIHSLTESQGKLMSMLECMNQRIDKIEKDLTTSNSVDSTSTSREEKIRVPPQLSVSL